MKPIFAESAFSQEMKHGERVSGDTFLSRKCQDGRLIAVLSDGLGSGVKASVLSTLTATMALSCVERHVPLEKTARTIAKTLPVCTQRKISYATFSLMELSSDHTMRVLEYDAPAFIHTRGVKVCPHSPGGRLREERFQAMEGDRLILFSDGVNQSGMGTSRYPLGWGQRDLAARIETILEKSPSISASRLSQELVNEAIANDGDRARDDITCGVLYLRRPRTLLVASGPPFNSRSDSTLGAKVREFAGRRIICGGTTAQILARELGLSINMNMPKGPTVLPPPASIEGFDIVSEGILTLASVARYLEARARGKREKAPEPAQAIIDTILDSDIITFIIGRRINEAHQDPAMPGELELRRNVVQRIVEILERDFLKEVHYEYL